MQKLIRWSEEKNQLLILQRGVSFEEVLEEIAQERIIAKQTHPNREKYPNQKIFIVRMGGYIYYVPFVEGDDEIFLKSIIPSRKLNKNYGENDEN